MSPLEIFVFTTWPIVLFLVLRFIQIRDVYRIDLLELSASEARRSTEAAPKACDQVELSQGQEIVVEISEDISFRATFCRVDVGADGSPWMVFKVGDAPEKMLPFSRVWVRPV